VRVARAAHADEHARTRRRCESRRALRELAAREDDLTAAAACQTECEQVILARKQQDDSRVQAAVADAFTAVAGLLQAQTATLG
jgi:hypothetical protein